MAKLKSFKIFSEERVSPMVITFGRFQPPSSGHEKVFEKVVSLAQGNNYRIYTSQSVDEKSNPLSYSDKIKFLRKMFPKYGRNIIDDTSIKTVFDALVKLYKQGITKITLVVGSDRIEEFTRLLKKYNGVKANHGFYEFKDGIQLASSGDRDPDSDAVEGMSASKLRAACAANNIDAFKKGMPKDFKEAIDLFNAVRIGMGLKESHARQHVKLDTVSEDREQFVKGTLFSVGDSVQINESKETGTIIELGPNFVVVKTATEQKRKWITAITKI